MKKILLCGFLSFGCAALAAATEKPLYENNFEKAEAGKVPEDLMVLGGEFTVKSDGTNKFLELPGAPLDSFAIQFGPTESADVAVSARIFGATKSRRAPTFGVGLGGVGGFKLQMSPGKKALELLKDQDLNQSVGFDWKSGTWTRFRLQIHKLKEGTWRVEGKAWPQGETEPKAWLISFDAKDEPVAGKASAFGSPFAGTPIAFDDLVVEKVAGE